MDILGCEKSYPRMGAFGIVPGKEYLAKDPGILYGAEPYGEFRSVFLLGMTLTVIAGAILRRFNYSHRKRTEQLEDQIEELQEEVVVVTGSSVV